MIKIIGMIFLLIISMVPILNAEMIVWDDEKDITPTAFLTEKYKDYKTHDSSTGANCLKIDIEIDVKEKGEYRLLGVLQYSTTGQHIGLYEDKFPNLDKGIHKITLSFDGNDIFKAKTEKFCLSVKLGILTSQEEVSGEKKVSYAAIGERTYNLSQYNYREFRQTPIVIKDKTILDSQIAVDLLKGTWLSFGVIEETIKEVSLIDFIGFELIASPYKLYSGLVSAIPATRYVAISKDRTSAFSIWDTDTFNDFIRSLDLLLKDDKKIINVTEAFMKITSGPSPPQILWEIPPATQDEKMSLQEWFSEHAEHKFHPPIVKITKAGFSVEYYTWTENAGVLDYHIFKLKNDGEIVEHTIEHLSAWIGHYAII